MKKGVMYNNLSIKNLTIKYRLKAHEILALDNINLDVPAGKCIGLVGESGSGKTTIAKACMGFVSDNGVVSGGVFVKDTDIINTDKNIAKKLRGETVALMFQKPEMYFHPNMSIISQLAEVFIKRRKYNRKDAFNEASEKLSSFYIDETHQRLYPHQLSGGQLSRAMFCMSMLLEPDILILDEPTASLDKKHKELILEKIQNYRTKSTSILLISHDLEVITNMCDDIYVLYFGEIVEKLSNEKFCERPAHPYTFALKRSFPFEGSKKQLMGIKGDVFSRIVHRHDENHFQHVHTVNVEESFDNHAHIAEGGCLFAPRCPQKINQCFYEKPLEIAHQEGFVKCLREGVVKSLHVVGVVKSYSTDFRMYIPHFSIYNGELYSIVGETGSGKTTFAKIVAGVIKPDSGDIFFEDVKAEHAALFSKHVGFLPQNPFSSVNPRFSVGEVLYEAFELKRLDTSEDKVSEILRSVKLPTDRGFLGMNVMQLNAGSLQRLCLARALIGKPSILVADEPTSSLDPSIQAKIVNMLQTLQVEYGLTVLFITHNITLAQKISDKIFYMSSGMLSDNYTDSTPKFV